MYGTHNDMTSSSLAPTSTSTAPPTPPEGDPSRVLDVLDDRLVAVRRMLQRAGYRQRLLAGLSRNLELGTLRLVRVVQRAATPPSIGDVAEALAVDPSTASRVVDGAVASGLLERGAATDDRRRVQLHVTAEGEAVLDEVTVRRRALLAQVTRDWDADDLITLVSLLERLVDDFDQLEGSA